MQALFLKTVRWFIVVAFVVAGLGALKLAEQNDTIRPVLPGILCLGAAFVLGTAWKDMRRKILFITLVFVTGLAFLAQFVEAGVYILTGDYIEINYFIGWGALCLIIGFPVMMFMYHKYD